MGYQLDLEDVFFNCFEYLNFSELTQFEPFKDHSDDLYRTILEEVYKFSQNELAPLYVSGDREGCQFHEGHVTVPQGYREAYKLCAENGFVAMDVPAEFGGNELPACLLAVAYECFTGANVSFAMYIGLTKGAADLIRAFARPEDVERFCRKMYGGEWGGTMCLTEPQAGSDVGALRTEAEPIEGNVHAMKGSKIFISSGDHDVCDNIIHLVLGRVKGDPAGTKGISLFVVPKIWVNEDGSLGGGNHVACVNIEHKMGIKAQATCSLNFGEKGLCKGILIGERGRGLEQMFQLMTKARILTGMQGLAIGARAYEEARQYAKVREQRGRPIIEYPDVRRNLSLCKSLVEGMRGLLYRTAFLKQKSMLVSDAAEREALEDQVELMVPVCKAYCSDWGFRVTELAIQIHGGYGYISEYPVEQFMRDAKISSIYEGTNGIQALDLLGRKLTQKGGQLFRSYYEQTRAFAARCESIAALQSSGRALGQAMDRAGAVVMKLAEWGMGGNQARALLAATPFLEMLGHILCGRILLEQAELALTQQPTVFYQNKIRTARFFINEFMPRVDALSKSILSEDQSVLEILF